MSCKNCPVDTYNQKTGLIAPEKCIKCNDFVPHTSTFGKTGQISNTECLCDSGFYPEWHAKDQHVLVRCKACPEGGICGRPSNSEDIYNTFKWMKPQLGYWKTPLDRNVSVGTASADGIHNANWGNVPIDNIFVKCKLEHVCTENGCAKGHSSILCDSCAKKYGKHFGKCLECNEDTLIWTSVVLIIICILGILVLYCIIKHMRKSFSRKLKAAWKELVNVLKLNIDFMQIGNSMPSVLAVEWPKVFLEWVNLFQFIDIDFLQLAGASCIDGINFTSRFTFMSCLPLTALIAGSIYYARGKFQNKKRIDSSTEQEIKLYVRHASHEMFLMVDEDHSGIITKEEYIALMENLDVTLSDEELEKISPMDENQFRYDFIEKTDAKEVLEWWWSESVFSNASNATVQILLLVHTPVTRLVFQYFNCYSVHHRKFLKEDSRIECFPQVNDGNYDNDLWNNYLIYVIVIGVAFTIGFPSMLFTYLHLHRKDLQDPDIKAKVGFLYAPFTKGAELWEIHEIIRKTLLTGVIIYLQSRPIIQACTAILICVISCCTLNYFEPHKNRILFWLAQVSFVTTTLKFLVSIVIINGQTSDTEKEDIGYLLISFDILFFISSIAACVGTVYLLRKKIGKIEKDIKSEMKKQRSKLLKHKKTLIGKVKTYRNIVQRNNTHNSKNNKVFPADDKLMQLKKLNEVKARKFWNASS